MRSCELERTVDQSENSQHADVDAILEVLFSKIFGNGAIICHGSSQARAIKNAIGVAVRAVASHLSQDIEAEFARGGAVA